MKPHIAIILAFCLCACCARCSAAESSIISTNIQTHFVEHGILSAAEISNVVELARQCGLDQAASVNTYYFQPISIDWNFGIEVKGREIESARRISWVTVDVYRHETSPDRKMKSLGKFWVADGEVRTNEFASFIVSNRTIRVKMPRTLALDTADKILKAFATRKIRYGTNDPLWRQAVEEYDFSAPDELTGPGNAGVYKIRKGEYGGCELEFKVEGDSVEIVAVSHFAT